MLERRQFLIPFSYYILDIHLVSNCESIVHLYVRNQFIGVYDYEIVSINLEISEFVVISAIIDFNCDTLVSNNFDESVDGIYKRPSNILDIRMQQNGLGFIDQTQYKTLKQNGNSGGIRTR